MNIGERIKTRRKELGLSVDEVAEKLNKNRATIYRYESNDIENLPVNILEPLAKVLNTTPSYLMGWDKELDTYKENFIKFSKAHNKNYFEKEILKNLNQLNDTGKKEAVKRVAELTEIPRYKKEIWEEEGKEDLIPNAAHMREGATEEDIQHDNDIMNNDDLWND